MLQSDIYLSRAEGIGEYKLRARTGNQTQCRAGAINAATGHHLVSRAFFLSLLFSPSRDPGGKRYSLSAKYVIEIAAKSRCDNSLWFFSFNFLKHAIEINVGFDLLSLNHQSISAAQANVLETISAQRESM